MAESVTTHEIIKIVQGVCSKIGHWVALLKLSNIESQIEILARLLLKEIEVSINCRNIHFNAGQ
ncbi:MAG: hypothetical protein H8D23_25090 [Candidatus Brocadiales bacterium]|nr:hypothetical protein [Candidatus Brocadiales bacterium]